MTEENYGEQGYVSPGRDRYTRSREGRRFYMLAFIIGGGLGAMASLLLAPHPGRESREKMKGLSLEVREKAGAYCEEALEKLGETIDRGVPLIKSAIDAGMRAWEREKRRIGGAASGGLTK